MFASFFVVILGLCCCCKESRQFFGGHPRLYGPSEALVKQIVTFQCEVPNHPMDQEILLQIFKEGNRAKMLGESTSLKGETGNITLFIKKDHEGYLECVASAQNKSTSDINATVSDRHFLKVIEQVKGAQIVHSGPAEFFEGRTLNLSCELSAGNYVSYKWLHNDQLLSPSSSHRFADNQLTISSIWKQVGSNPNVTGRIFSVTLSTTSEHSGSYMCEAANIFNHTVFTSKSYEVVITVKDVVSTPNISFTVLKEEPQNYFAKVICGSTRGALPIIFSLYHGEHLLNSTRQEERHAEFKLPLILDKDVGYLWCQASNGEKTKNSSQLHLHVVTVGGPVTIHYEYDTENYAATGLRFYCKAKKGSYPRYQWFLNKTLLQGRGSFYYVVDKQEQSMLELKVGESITGTYHCEVSNSFDNTTTISSKRRYLDIEVLNRLPDFVVGVVFGCFAFLILLVSACCWAGLIFRRRQYGEKSLWSPEIQRGKAAYEGELCLSVYNEDLDLLNTVREDEFDQASEASEDDPV